MVQFVITLNVPNPVATEALNGLKKMDPVIGNETDLQYIKRIVVMYLTDKAKEGLLQIQKESIGNVIDPGMTAT